MVAIAEGRFAYSAADARAYWTRTMDEAYAFMQRIREVPLRESGEPVMHLPAAIAAGSVRIRFTVRPHVGGLSRQFFLRQSLVSPLLAAAAELNDRGLVMVIEDAYRSPEMQRGLTRSPQVLDLVAGQLAWESPAGAELTPERLLRRVAALVANWPRTATHMSASALDISVVDEATGEELDRGGSYLTLSALTPMHSPLVGPQARANRALITEIMERNGFVAYPYEFWHYSSGDTFSGYLAHAGTPARFGPVLLDPTTGATSPLADLEGELNPIDEVRELAAAALQRAVAPPASAPDEAHPVAGGLLSGGCLCGGVRFEVEAPLLRAGWCHCSRCRRRTGGPASVQGRVAPGSLRIVSGAELVGSYHPDDGFAKEFCSRCGSQLWSRDPDDDGVLSVRLGAFDGDPGIRPSYHQFVADAALWQELPDDGLPRYPGRRPA